jgi:hypothetical protein
MGTKITILDISKNNTTLFFPQGCLFKAWYTTEDVFDSIHTYQTVKGSDKHDVQFSLFLIFPPWHQPFEKSFAVKSVPKSYPQSLYFFLYIRNIFSSCALQFYPENGRNRFLWNRRTFQLNYITSHPRYLWFYFFNNTSIITVWNTPPCSELAQSMSQWLFTSEADNSCEICIWSGHVFNQSQVNLLIHGNFICQNCNARLYRKVCRLLLL